MRPPPVRLTLRAVTRRDLLAGAGATVALASCDRLDVPDGTDTALPAAGDVLPPITANDDFYVTSCCGTPEIDRDAWTLAIVDESSAQLATLDMAALEAMPAREKEHTLECIGASPYFRSIGNAIWTGLPLPEIFAALGVNVPAGAVEIVFTGADDYQTSIPIGDLAKPVWLVWKMNGEPLPDRHGATARILTPGRYGIKNPKWLTEIRFVSEPVLGFWESRGWSNSAEYRANTFFLSPSASAVLTAGPVRFLGTAFAGSDPIERVELSTDGGETWEDAEITYANGPDVWTLWAFDWQAVAGDYEIQVRATTESGDQSALDPAGTDPFGGYNGSMRIAVSVRN
jgi:DMSO/TMAO reductase YedYZ molybdopterin-dependent catalytic subunit